MSMPYTTCHMSISLDGFVAGPDQSRDDPLGKRGIELHHWHLGDERANDADQTATAWLMRPRGAYVMGRNMFGPIRGAWDEDWRGWWGPEPPYHAPVFVLTHHPRDPIEMDGGTTFHFVTDGFDAAYAQARERPPASATSTSRAAPRPSARHFSAGVIDELTLDLVPVLLGSGEDVRRCRDARPRAGRGAPLAAGHPHPLPPRPMRPAPPPKRAAVRRAAGDGCGRRRPQDLRLRRSLGR